MLGPFNSLHEHFSTDKTYLLYMKITYISLIHGVGIRVCITIGPSIWDEAIFQFGWEGGGGRKDGDRVSTYAQLEQGHCIFS